MYPPLKKIKKNKKIIKKSIAIYFIYDIITLSIEKSWQVKKSYKKYLIKKNKKYLKKVFTSIKDYDIITLSIKQVDKITTKWKG